MERRFSTRQVRLEQRADKQPTIVGYAAVFYRADDPGTQFELFEGLQERIATGAFDKLASDDVRGLFNHDPRLILGRASAKTMRVSVDEIGLRYEIDAPDTTAGRDTVESIRRGDVDGSSFAFMPRQNGVRWEGNPDGTSVRWLLSLEVFDVGPVTYPAYESTTAGARGRDHGNQDTLAEWRAFQAIQQQRAAKIAAYSQRRK